MEKLSGLARALTVVVAVIAAFAAIPEAALILVVLGLIAGLGYNAAAIPNLTLTILVLPLAGGALANIPSVGGQLSSIADNVALGLAGAAATAVAVSLFNLVKDDATSLTK
jgi:hypothetical protein